MSNRPVETSQAIGAAPKARPAHDETLFTLQHGLRALEAVAEAEGIVPKQLAAVLHLSLATTYRIVNTLMDAGYLVRGGDGALLLGDAFGALADKFDHRPDPFPELLPMLLELAERSGDVAALGRLVGRQCMLVSVQALPGSDHGGHLRAGQGGPSHTMALGKVLVASLEPGYAVALLRAHRLEPSTDRTVTELDRLLTELETVRTRGWAVDVEEGESGLCCLAARISVPLGVPALAISVAVSPDRLRIDHERLARLVIGAARRSAAILAQRN
jgi:DNA-binding IclR family transcriptional regulator